jgi:hypothetical protein
MKMAVTQEVWIVEGVEGKTRREQIARLGEWKKLFLSEGADSVHLWEGGYGEFVGAWFFAVEYESATAFGASMDRVAANSKSFDDAMEAWQKTPTLKFRSGGLLHKIDQL